MFPAPPRQSARLLCTLAVVLAGCVTDQHQTCPQPTTGPVSLAAGGPLPLTGVTFTDNGAPVTGSRLATWSVVKYAEETAGSADMLVIQLPDDATPLSVHCDLDSWLNGEKDASLVCGIGLNADKSGVVGALAFANRTGPWLPSEYPHAGAAASVELMLDATATTTTATGHVLQLHFNGFFLPVNGLWHLPWARCL